MTDPQDALASFQEAFTLKALAVKRCTFDPAMWVFADTINGLVRIVYARNVGRTVVAFANFVESELVGDTPCFDVGWAVPASHRNQGLATATVRAALVEMTAGFRRYGPFYVDAVVGVDNVASQKVATKTLSDAPINITDGVSGLPALHYRKRCE